MYVLEYPIQLRSTSSECIFSASVSSPLNDIAAKIVPYLLTTEIAVDLVFLLTNEGFPHVLEIVEFLATLDSRF